MQEAVHKSAPVLGAAVGQEEHKEAKDKESVRRQERVTSGAESGAR